MLSVEAEPIRHPPSDLAYYIELLRVPTERIRKPMPTSEAALAVVCADECVAQGDIELRRCHDEKGAKLRGQTSMV